MSNYKNFEKDFHTILNQIVINRHDIDKAIWQEKEITKKAKFKSFISGTKILTWFGIIIYSIMCLAIIVCSTSYSFLGVTKESIEEIKNNDSIINYVSNLNHYSYIETIDIISDFNYDAFEFIFLEIIIPTLFILFGYILIIVTLKDILELTKNVYDNNTLFTDDKNQLIKKIILRVYIALLFVLGNFILWLGIGMILEIIQYMFNYCVQLTNEKISYLLEKKRIIKK